MIYMEIIIYTQKFPRVQVTNESHETEASCFKMHFSHGYRIHGMRLKN